MYSGTNPSKSLLVQNMVSGCLKVSTEAGNMRLPTSKKIVQWVLGSWSALSKEVIVEWFKSCALNIANNVSKNDEIIHLLKPKEPCHAGRRQLKLQLSVLDERSRDNPSENTTDSFVKGAVDDLNVVDPSNNKNDIDNEI